MKNILVIEDEPSVRSNLKELLDKAGFNAVVAEDGWTGIRLAEKHLPDLILCDIMMPEIDGYFVLQELNKKPATAGIPFIFLTAKSEMSDMRSGMDLGADDYLTKPFRAGELLRAIGNRLNKIDMIIQSREQSGPKVQNYVMVGNPPEILNLKNIVYITAMEGYSHVYSDSGKKLLVRKLLKEWESLLPGETFLRIHNSTIINIEFHTKIEKWFNNTFRIYLRNIAEPFIVSKRYSAKLKHRLKI
ncbi:MAG: response regulator [Ignavibacteriales bacterium]